MSGARIGFGAILVVAVIFCASAVRAEERPMTIQAAPGQAAPGSALLPGAPANFVGGGMMLNPQPSDSLQLGKGGNMVARAEAPKDVSKQDIQAALAKAVVQDKQAAQPRSMEMRER